VQPETINQRFAALAEEQKDPGRMISQAHDLQCD
jgi:hypothetical protein